MEAFSTILWTERFWVPDGKTWKDLSNNEDNTIYIAQLYDLRWALPLGALLLLVRYAVELYILTPFGVWVGIREKKFVHASPNPILENYYLKNGINQAPNGVNNNCNNNNNTVKHLEIVAKQTDMTIREVEIWLRKRRKQSATPTMKKFTECSWHFVFYLAIFIYGLMTLWTKDWFWDSRLCYKGWPNLHVTNDVYWYYLVELAFYWSLVFSLITDHKRKDFGQMIIHHVATMFLLYFSWIINFPNIGCIVLLLHDAADPALAAAKMAKYSGRLRLCNILIGVFFVTWIVLRIIVYPFRILYSTTIEFSEFVDGFPAYYFQVGLLFLLQILHIVWAIMIAKTILSAGRGKFGYKYTAGNVVRGNRTVMQSESSLELPHMSHEIRENVNSQVKLVSGGGGKCRCEMTVQEEHQNRGGTLHGGMTSTLVDVVSTWALMGSNEPVAGVSVDLSVSFFKPAAVGETIVIDAQTLRRGKRLAFLTVDIMKEDGTLLAQGKHTKYVG